jgi:hypothetical protein
MKKAILLPAIMIIGSALYAQDLHFSQYMQTPSLVNPALTGASTVVRASVIYKDQWRSVTVPYKTYGASFEMKFKASNWEKADKFKTKTYKQSFSRMAGGLSFFRDKAGDGNMGSTQVNLWDYKQVLCKRLLMYQSLYFQINTVQQGTIQT